MPELRGTEREKGLPLQAYMTDSYFSSTQWESFRFQVKAVKTLLDKGTVLEIGCGGGYASSILNSLGLMTETLDINKNLNPTYVGDISRADYVPPKLYDCVLCAEVLEHIPFEFFDICLDNIRKTTKKYAVITLPNSFRRRFVIGLRVNGHYREIGFGTKKTPLPSIHFWQLNSDSYCTYQEILSHIERFFVVKDKGPVMVNKHRSLMGNEYHYYYILENNADSGSSLRCVHDADKCPPPPGHFAVIIFYLFGWQTAAYKRGCGQSRKSGVLDIVPIPCYGSIGAVWATALVHIISSALCFGYMCLYLRRATA